jgi:predicted ester cyclase
VRDLRAAFPDIRFSLEELIAEGEVVAARYHWRGTHRGVFLGIAPTGRAIVVRGMDFYRISGGRLVEHWDNVDEFGMLSQLGDLG